MHESGSANQHALVMVGMAFVPEAPGEYGQPPSPAIDESMVLIPICSAVSTLEHPCPYVSCICAAIAFTGIAFAHSCTNQTLGSGSVALTRESLWCDCHPIGAKSKSSLHADR